ncbi:restriction endonuclease subunit S [Rhizobium leguminosarum]|uniref:restriction endonuclease subunit S n=1 Tax=Rhizobium leguminosarum TaxID=384 RepID=UPI0010304AC5|nr:restriction endonuclease subunit S [Rhizobium leguminosarum]MBY5905327.1 restriction endonuclease subunit S [Rhizobium leguminosarum]MBY5912418.1 restriction endonuclease subunit S [Rhizobium leguminosarum]TAZ60857.1 restriction endonuclease subunit S [Rhizobium leguminosarum]
MSVQVARLGDIAEDLRSGFACGVDDPDGVIQFRMNNVERDGALNWTKMRRVPEAMVKSGLTLQPKDILLNATNSPDLVGKTALFVGADEPITFSNHFLRLRMRTKAAEPAYVARWLRRQFELGNFKAMCRSWVNQASITRDQVSNLEIPLPPLDEQRRIAAILDKADQLRQKRRHAIALLESLTQSIFLEMFGDLAASTDKWPRVALSEVAEIGSGITKGRKTNSTSTIEVPYLAVANVQDKALNLATVKTIEATPSEIDKYKLEADDLLLTEGGDPDKLGRGTLWRGELPLAIHQNHIFRVRFTSAQIDPLYANWVIGSEYGKRYFLKSAKQTTGIASINKSQLSGFPVILPPVNLQRSFVKRAEAVSSQIRSHTAHLDSFNSAFSALQTSAFRGGI